MVFPLETLKYCFISQSLIVAIQASRGAMNILILTERLLLSTPLLMYVLNALDILHYVIIRLCDLGFYKINKLDYVTWVSINIK